MCLRSSCGSHGSQQLLDVLGAVTSDEFKLLTTTQRVPPHRQIECHTLILEIPGSSNRRDISNGFKPVSLRDVSSIRDTDRTNDAGDKTIWYERQDIPTRRHKCWGQKEKGGHDEVMKEVSYDRLRGGGIFVIVFGHDNQSASVPCHHIRPFLYPYFRICFRSTV